MKISSPAYMLPNSRSDSDSGRTASSITRRSRLNGANHGPNGAVNHSLKKPNTPLCLMPMYWISRNTVRAMPTVVLMSAVGTTRR